MLETVSLSAGRCGLVGRESGRESRLQPNNFSLVPLQAGEAHSAAACPLIQRKAVKMGPPADGGGAATQAVQQRVAAISALLNTLTEAKHKQVAREIL
jgi:hypothetical protein